MMPAVLFILPITFSFN